MATLGAPGDLPREPRRKNDEKGSSRTPPRDSFWGPLGDLGRHRADIFFVFGCRVGDLCDDRRFDGQNALHKRSPRPPQTMKPMVSPLRDHYFRISTCTSKMIGNCFQWVPLWDPFGWFWGPLGDFFGDKKSRKWKERGSGFDRARCLKVYDI